MPPVEWDHITRIATQSWTCGFCGREVSSDKGWLGVGAYSVYRQASDKAWIAICPRCSIPSLVAGDITVPPAPYGRRVEHLPEDVETLHDEARQAVALSPNSAAYACRKILMHVAVEKGAEPNQSFARYVTYLQEHHLTPGTSTWVDEIRQLGNDANHEIDLMTVEEAKTVVDFTAMLLQIVYEFPTRGEESARRRQAD